MSAVRVARGFTGPRPRGEVRRLLPRALRHAAGGRGQRRGHPGAARRRPACRASAVADTVVVPYNVVPELDERVACVIVEPVAANMGLVAPAPGFLAGLRAACDAAGALLVFDEVITGFRVGPGGMSALLGGDAGPVVLRQGDRRRPPGGRVRGQARRPAVLAPDGPVYQAGTLVGESRSPPRPACAVLEAVTAADYDALSGRAATPGRGPARRHRRGRDRGPGPGGGPPGRPVLRRRARHRLRVGARLRWAPASTHRSSPPCSTGAWRSRPGPYEAMFPGLAHLDIHLDEVVDVAAEAAAEVARRHSSVG